MGMARKWRKPSAQLQKAFLDSLPKDPRIELRNMFGCPCAFVNGNMFAGLHQETVVFRLAEGERQLLLKEEEAAIFEPHPGRRMREYVALPAAFADDSLKMQTWVTRALEYAASTRAKKLGSN
jgi:TfoX/Sxy family transcriptional regulator of competence genes